MGHEVILFGSIEGATGKAGEGFRALQMENASVIQALPAEDDWPWLVRGLFALPAAEPFGIYRSQVIHFGGSFKDEPGDRSSWDTWIGKFEALLSRLYWYSAFLHLRTEFEPDRLYEWLPDRPALDGLLEARPVESWTRVVREVAEAEVE